MIGKPATPEAYQLLHQGTLALAEVEVAGMKIDVDYLNKSIKRTNSQIKEIESELEGDKLFRIWRRINRDKTNLGSRQQLARVLVAEGILKNVQINPKTNFVKADETALEKTGHPFVAKYIKMEKLKKAESTYLRGIKREVVDGFIHPIFNLNIPITYRGSCECPNTNNQPKQIEEMAKLVRTAFIPRKNHVLIELDFKGVEVCVAACYNKDPNLISYVKDKTKDMHRDTAADLFKCDIKDVSKDMRFHAKNQFVFAEFYGSVFQQCAPSLWESIKRHDLTMSDGTKVLEHLRENGIKSLGPCTFDREYQTKKGTYEHLVKAVEESFWGDRFKVYAKWKEDWWKQYLKRGWAEYHTGFVIRGLYKRNEVINYPIQGSAFHCLLWCLIKLIKWIRKHKMKSRVINQVHDSLICDVHEKELEVFLGKALHLMRNEILKHWPWLIVPLDVEGELYRKNWYEKEEIRL
jgi:DNA polymerase-1